MPILDGSILPGGLGRPVDSMRCSSSLAGKFGWIMAERGDKPEAIQAIRTVGAFRATQVTYATQEASWQDQTATSEQEKRENASRYLLRHTW